MKIAILSDFHFGYAYNIELENDSFDNAEEAMAKALDADLILLGGDIFDTRIPKTQAWANAIRILTKPLLKSNSGIRLVDCSKELKEISRRTLNHIPVVALHGNHERRPRTEINTVQVLENAGILIHLHCQTIIFEKNGVRVAIHGMSSVPERFAKDVLNQWNPKPIEGCVNILFLHQNIDPYVYSPLEPPSLELSNLPKGFDFIIDSHIHMHTMEKIDNTAFIIPGSTIITQFQRNEAEIEKTIVKIDTESKNVDFIPLENSRKFFYEEIKIDSNSSARGQIEQRLHEIIFTRNLVKPPIIRIRLMGKETEVLDRELRDIERAYAGKAILVFAKELESPEITEKIEFLRNLREQKLSVEEIGLNLLRKNLDELGFESTFNHEEMFNLLENVDNAFNVLIGEQKTLSQFR